MRRAIVSGCVLLAVASACSSSAPKFSGGPRATTTTVAHRPTTTPKAPPVTDPPSGPQTGSTAPPVSGAPAGGLAGLLITAVPSGFAQQIDAVADTGPTDLAKAALDDNSVNARRALLVTGFVQGYQRLWSGVDAAQNEGQNFLFLYQFRSALGASGYATHWQDTDVQNASGTAAPVKFSPAYIPGSVGLRIDDKSGSTGVVIFSKGVYAVRAIVNGAATTDPSQAVTALAEAEYLKLP